MNSSLSRNTVAAACGCVGACAALLHFGSMAKAARDDAMVVSAAIADSEAAIVAAATGGKAKTSKATGSSRMLKKLRRKYYDVAPPSLGMLGMGKLAGMARFGGVLLIAGRAIDWAVHSGLAVERGSMRAKGRELRGVIIAKVLARTGATSLAVATVLTSIVGARCLLKKRTTKLPFAEALESIGRDLHRFGQTRLGADFRTHSEGMRGWLLKEHADRPLIDVTSDFHSRLAKLAALHAGSVDGEPGSRNGKPISRSELIEAFGSPRIVHQNATGWDAITVLLVPGLWTKWYPRYFSGLVEVLKRCAIEVRISKVDSDSTLRANMETLEKELTILTASRSVVIYAHSKGAIDVSAAIERAPQKVRSRIAALVSCQGPHGGSLVGNDVLGTNTQRNIISFLFSSVLGGSGLKAVTDLGYAARRAYFAAHPEQWWLPSTETWVPTLCFCSSATHQPRSLLSPIVEYYRYRYECGIDGLCAREDTALPGAPAVFVSDMDHFGPAWSGFPSTDRYDSTHVFFVLVTMALDHRHKPFLSHTDKKKRKKLKREVSHDSTDADLDEEEEATLRATDSFVDAKPPPIVIDASSRDVKNAISRACSWGWFDASTMTTPTNSSSRKHHESS